MEEDATSVSNAKYSGIYANLLAAVLLMTLACLFALASPTAAHASFKGTTAWNVDITVGGSTFKSVQYYDGSDYTYRIVKTTASKTTTVISDVAAGLLTNGKTLYYSKVVSRSGKYADSNVFKKRIYQLDLTTGKAKKVASGYDCTAFARSGNYLYYGTTVESPEGWKLRALNLKTGNVRVMAEHVGMVQCSGNRVVTMTNTGALANLPMYVFKRNGKKVKRLPDGCGVTIKGKKIYFVKARFGTTVTYREYTCNLNGKKIKAVTKWKKKYPKRYLN